MSLMRSAEKFTWGIVNLPINCPITERYPFFELDRTEDSTVNIHDYLRVLESYRLINAPLLTHTTGRGVHFLSFRTLSKENYKAWIQPIKKLNPLCPMVTLRITPNKWFNERFDWEYHFGAEKLEQYTQFVSYVTNQRILSLKGQYKIVRYPMNGDR